MGQADTPDHPRRADARLQLPQVASWQDGKAVDILRGLAEQSPERYPLGLALSLTNLGVTLRALGQPQEALAIHREAVEILHGLAEQSPEQYRPELARSLTNLSGTPIGLGRVRDGVDARREAVTILHQCAADNPSCTVRATGRPTGHYANSSTNSVTTTVPSPQPPTNDTALTGADVVVSPEMAWLVLTATIRRSRRGDLRGDRDSWPDRPIPAFYISYGNSS